LRVEFYFGPVSEMSTNNYWRNRIVFLKHSLLQWSYRVDYCGPVCHDKR